MKLILFLLVVLITGCQWQKEFSKKDTAKVEEKKDVETKASEEKTVKTNDSDYYRKTWDFLLPLINRPVDTNITNVTTPVYNNYYPVRYTEESGRVSKTEDTNKKDTSTKDNSTLKTETTTDENKSSSGSFMNLGWLIGFGLILLIVGYLFSKIQIKLKS